MLSFKSIVLVASALLISAECIEVTVPAPLAQFEAPVHTGYAQQVPQNIPPHGAQVNEFSRYLNLAFGAPAAPFAAPLGAPLAAPLSAPVPFPYSRLASPYFAGPAPYAFPPALNAPFSYPSPYASFGPAFFR